jgi:hypothetical protein
MPILIEIRPVVSKMEVTNAHDIPIIRILYSCTSGKEFIKGQRHKLGTKLSQNKIDAEVLVAPNRSLSG